MPQRYQLILEASGFHIPLESRDCAGFVCARRVLADSEEEAGSRAVEELLAEPRVAAMVESTREHFGTADSCKVRVDACFRIGWLRWTFSPLPRDFLFYENDESGESAAE